MQSKNSSCQDDLWALGAECWIRFAHQGDPLPPKSLIPFCRSKQIYLSTAWDEVNGIQKASKTYEATNSSI